MMDASVRFETAMNHQSLGPCVICDLLVDVSMGGQLQQVFLLQ